jgi:signal transduction histidine kinase
MIKSTSRSTSSFHKSPPSDENAYSSALSSLNRERKRLRAIFQILHEAVLLVDAKGKISFYNRTAQQLLALPEKAKRMPHLWHWIPTLKSFFTQPDPNSHPDILATETELIYPEKRFVRLQLQPFSEVDGRPLFIILLQDVTKERTQSEEQLFQRCLDSVTQLASELAHELGNPLNAIGIHLQLVQRALKNLFSTADIATHSEKPTHGTTETDIISPKTTLSASKNIEKSTPETCATLPLYPSQTATVPETSQQPSTPSTSDTAIVPIAPIAVVPILEQQSPLQHFTSSQTAEPLQTLLQSLSVCQSEVQRLDTLVQQFLKSVRPQSLELKRGSILQPLKKVLAVLKPQLDNAHITVELRISNPLPLIFMDADRLHQAFFNVLKNAREAIGTNGRIAISCEQDERYLIFLFADSGGGFPETQAIQLFSQSHTTTRPNGHGIGMLIVQRIMREHNGFVEIQTKASVGSVVSLKFPLPEPMTQKIETERSESLKEGKKKKKS